MFMLHKISVENFFCIADRQELTFAVPGNAPNLPNFRTPLSNNNTRLPVVVGLFGPNASGKSTVLKAIVSSVIFARNSFGWESTGMNFQAFRQRDWLTKPTKISIDFDSKLGDGQLAMFRYELHITHETLEDKKVAYEALSYAPNGRHRVLFERTDNKFKFGSEFDISDKDDPRVVSIRPNASVISTLVQFNHPIANSIHKELTMQISGFHRSDNILEWYYKDNNLLQSLICELRRFDIGIESVSIEKGPQGLFAKFKHVGLDDFIFMHEQSEGTKRFIDIFPRLYYTLGIGSIAIIDEIDVHFHPLILPELFGWFNNPERNPKNAQLLFTAQNPVLLDDLEKEQVFFTEKPCSKSTIVYGAKDIGGLRRSPSLMKKYLSGELGAVPHFG